MSKPSQDVSPEIHIRPLTDKELERVASDLNDQRSPDTHRYRYQLQQDGMLTYLIAWHGDTPVGHGQILWGGPKGSPKQHLDHTCPYIEDLWVHADHRSRGIGTSIIHEMEKRSQKLGHTQIGLSVGIDNPRAITLYERIGFKTTDTPRYTLSGTVPDAYGKLNFWSEECTYMAKQL